jgi:hypothetical protein
MGNFPALDVAVGLFFVYFILALVCSTINETIAHVLGWRSKDLEKGIKHLLMDREPEPGQSPPEPSQSPPDPPDLTEKLFREHPLIDALIDPTGKRRYPSYIPSRTFTHALLDLQGGAVSAVQAAETAQAQLERVQETINAIPSARVRDALNALLRNAEGNVPLFRRRVEQWYDDAMERVSGWYRRRVQKVLWVLAAFVALLINADTLQIGKRLWTDPGVRAALVNQAASAVGPSGPTGATGASGARGPLAPAPSRSASGAHASTGGIPGTATPAGSRGPAARTLATASSGATGPTGASGVDPVREIKKLPVALGWHWRRVVGHDGQEADPQGFPIWLDHGLHWAPFDFFSKLIGLALTAIALTLGAPFWFDTLSKLARLRSSGAPPPATEAVRHGEGEETRAGEPRLVIQATPEAQASSAPPTSPP